MFCGLTFVKLKIERKGRINKKNLRKWEKGTRKGLMGVNERLDVNQLLGVGLPNAKNTVFFTCFIDFSWKYIWKQVKMSENARKKNQPAFGWGIDRVSFFENNLIIGLYLHSIQHKADLSNTYVFCINIMAWKQSISQTYKLTLFKYELFRF